MATPANADYRQWLAAIKTTFTAKNLIDELAERKDECRFVDEYRATALVFVMQ